MPGILSMAQNGADSANVRKLQEVQKAGAVNESMHAKANGDTGAAHLNGPALTNGKAIANGFGLAGQGSSTAITPVDAPPLLHNDMHYANLGELVGRVTQDTNNTLGELLDKMAEIQVPGASAINGVNGHAATNGSSASSPANDRKKLMMLDWAWQSREKFIKLMVLSTWSRRAGEVVKMVDLNMFLNEQMHVYGIAADAVGNLKLALQPFKAPNPDLKMALEVLSTGKAPWMPSLDYIPKEPLTPQQMLGTLRNVNTMLSIRINLHEDLPRHLKNYKIANGRATFVIPGEFELAVSIADEEPTSPFFVVDVKFLFTPTPEVLDDFFRLEVEPMANHYLANGGLTGCFDWLHNFVLTHKIATLRAQAIELSQEAWSGATQVHQFNRTLSVQYWSERPGPKSWIEIGISTGKPKKGWSWRGPEPSRIVLNWKRNGVLVEDVKVDMDLTNLSMERILMAVIALHTTNVLESIRNRLAISVYASSGLSINLDTSKEEPADCALRVGLVGSLEPTEVRIEPVSGSLVLSPANVLSSRLEHDINRSKDMTSDAAQRIEYQLCMHLKSYVDRQAANTGWTSLRNLNLSRTAIFSATHRKIVCSSFYRGQGWKGNWVMAVTINLDGESWWLMELADEYVGASIKDTVHLSLVTNARRRKPLDPKLLQAIEKIAVAQVSFTTIRRELTHRGIQHVVRHEDIDPANTNSPSSQPLRLGLPTIFIKTTELVAGSSHGNKQWANDYLRLYHHRFETRNSRVIHVMRGEMLKNHMPFRLVSSQDDDVSFTSNGTFAVTLRTPFGEVLLDRLINRLRRIERLGSYINVVKSRNLVCSHVSLSRIIFRYADKHKADISFQEGTPVTLTLDPSNPHRRALALLSQILNQPGGDGFLSFVSMLAATFSVLSAFQAVEARASNSPAPYVHLRSLESYRLAYDDPPAAFEINARFRKDEFLWEIAEARHPRPPQHHPEFAAALLALLNQEGKGWRGVGKAIVADSQGVGAAIQTLDEVVKGFVGKGPPPPQRQQQQQPNPAGGLQGNPQGQQMQRQPPGQLQLNQHQYQHQQGKQPLRQPPGQAQNQQQHQQQQQRQMQMQMQQRRQAQQGGGGAGGPGGPQPSEIITLD